jgi:hypothetical protein
MKKPFLKRPFALWLPAFGLLFLLWLWADSRHHAMTGYLGYNRDPNAGTFFVETQPSTLVLSLARVSGEARPPGRPLAAGTMRVKIPPHIATPRFPLPDADSEYESAPSSSIPGATFEFTVRSLSIPIWCLIPLYLVLWWAALRWHARRVNKLRQTQLAQAA